MSNQKYNKTDKQKTKTDNIISTKSKLSMTDDERIDAAAAKILKLYRFAFEELAK